MALAQARKLRKQMTDAERRLLLRAHRFGGVKFNRQVPIGPYVVDFACFNRKLITEADGGQHADNPDDHRREEWLRREGFRVLRFWNNDVLKNTQGVLEVISLALAEMAKPLSRLAALATLPTRGGGDAERAARPVIDRTCPS
jgi:very-short-patch-repair endonuclease